MGKVLIFKVVQLACFSGLCGFPVVSKTPRFMKSFLYALSPSTLVLTCRSLIDFKTILVDDVSAAPASSFCNVYIHHQKDHPFHHRPTLIKTVDLFLASLSRPVISVSVIKLRPH